MSGQKSRFSPFGCDTAGVTRKRKLSAEGGCGKCYGLTPVGIYS